MYIYITPHYFIILPQWISANKVAFTVPCFDGLEVIWKCFLLLARSKNCPATNVLYAIFSFLSTLKKRIFIFIVHSRFKALRFFINKPHTHTHTESMTHCSRLRGKENRTLTHCLSFVYLQITLRYIVGYLCIWTFYIDLIWFCVSDSWKWYCL